MVLENYECSIDQNALARFLSYIWVPLVPIKKAKRFRPFQDCLKKIGHIFFLNGIKKTLKKTGNG